VRSPDSFQATFSLGPVNSQGQNFSLDLGVQITGTWPEQDPQLPEKIEAAVHQAGLEAQRQLFGLLIEKADKELVLQCRHGKAGKGIQRCGTRPFTLKTSSVKSPSNARGSATSTMARSRPPRPSLGRRPTNWPSAPTSVTPPAMRWDASR